jgi:hypothetical protein
MFFLRPLPDRTLLDLAPPAQIILALLLPHASLMPLGDLSLVLVPLILAAPLKLMEMLTGLVPLLVPLHLEFVTLDILELPHVLAEPTVNGQQVSRTSAN